MAQQAASQQAGVVAAGGAVTGMVDLADPDNVMGLAEEIYIKFLALVAIVEWRGVFEAEGDAVAPIDETTVGDLMSISDIADTFLFKYLQPAHEMEAEGNAFGPAPNGTSVAGPVTAPAARKPAAAVPTVKKSKRCPVRD